MAKSKEEILAGVKLFSGLDRESLATLAATSFSRDFSQGETIVHEGVPGGGLYVIISGRVEVRKDVGSSRTKVLATLGAGQFFGEMALFDEWPRSASVRAVEPTSCVGIDRFKFVSVLSNHPKLAVTMLQVMAERLRRTDATLAE